MADRRSLRIVPRIADNPAPVETGYPEMYADLSQRLDAFANLGFNYLARHSQDEGATAGMAAGSAGKLEHHDPATAYGAAFNSQNEQAYMARQSTDVRTSITRFAAEEYGQENGSHNFAEKVKKYREGLQQSVPTPYFDTVDQDLRLHSAHALATIVGKEQELSQEKSKFHINEELDSERDSIWAAARSGGPGAGELVGHLTAKFNANLLVGVGNGTYTAAEADARRTEAIEGAHRELALGEFEGSGDRSAFLMHYDNATSAGAFDPETGNVKEREAVSKVMHSILRRDLAEMRRGDRGAEKNAKLQQNLAMEDMDYRFNQAESGAINPDTGQPFVAPSVEEIHTKIQNRTIPTGEHATALLTRATIAPPPFDDTDYADSIRVMADHDEPMPVIDPKRVTRTTLRQLQKLWQKTTSPKYKDAYRTINEFYNSQRATVYETLKPDIVLQKGRALEELHDRVDQGEPVAKVKASIISRYNKNESVRSLPKPRFAVWDPKTGELLIEETRDATNFQAVGGGFGGGEFGGEGRLTPADIVRQGKLIHDWDLLQQTNRAAQLETERANAAKDEEDE